MATYYVANTTSNGYTAGNNGNSGLSKSLAWLTLDFALSTAVAGDTITLNNDTFTAATFFNITKSLTITPETALGPTLKRTGAQARVVNIAAGAAATITIGAVVIDAESAVQPCITLGTSAFNLTLSGTQCINALHGGINGSGTTTANITLDGYLQPGTGVARYGLQLLTCNAGNIIVRNSTINCLSHGVFDTGPVRVTANAAGPTISVTNNSFTITIDPAATSAFDHPAVKIYNIPNAVVTGNTVSIGPTTGSATGAGICISGDTTTPLDSSGGNVANNTVTFTGIGGLGIVIGQNGTTAANNFANNATVTGNTITGDATAAAALMHGVIIGWNNGAVVSQNKTSQTGYGVIIKGVTIGGIAKSNIIDRAYLYALYSKGSVGAEFYNNTAYITTGYAGTSAIFFGDENTTGFHSTGGIAKNNSVFADITPGGFVLLDVSCVATFDSNNYGATASLPVSPWTYGATTYATLALWQAGHETTAMSVNPNFPAASSGNFYTRSVRLKRAGVAVGGVTTDYAGATFLSPPAVGAYQTHTA